MDGCIEAITPCSANRGPSPAAGVGRVQYETVITVPIRERRETASTSELARSPMAWTLICQLSSRSLE
ncbi:MAG: hypothetical protein CM15mP74_23700 [Halieaceae bacterium]|nr:MAG: hypothetical protein CM15mP74_23700 [Halieaceae bacterium]